MVVLAVGAQDLHLSPVDAGGHDQAVERVGLAFPAPHRADALGDAGAGRLDVDRPVAGVEDAEVVQEAFVAVLAQERRRPLLDHAQPEGFEDRHEVRELDLAVDLVQADVREGLPSSVALLGLVRQADQEPLLAPLQLVEARDVEARDRSIGRRLVVVGEPIRPALEQRPGAGLAVLLDQQVQEPVVPRAGDLPDLAFELVERHLGDLAVPDVHREVELRDAALGERDVVVDRRPVEPLEEQVLQPEPDLGVERVPRHRHQQRDAPPVRDRGARTAGRPWSRGPAADP